MNSCRFLCIYSVIVSVFIFCHCSIKRLLNASASTAHTDSCDCFAYACTNMNYNIRLTVISINCKNCSIGCPYNLFLRFPPLRFGAGFSSLAFSVAPSYVCLLWLWLKTIIAMARPYCFCCHYFTAQSIRICFIYGHKHVIAVLLLISWLKLKTI